MKNEVFKLVQNCIPVKGINQSLICDLHRKKYELIPNDLYNILVTYEGKSIVAVKNEFQNLYDDIIDEYFDFLLKNEYVFYTDTPNWFPKLSLEWNYPFKLSNAIVDRNRKSIFDFNKVLNELDELNCKNIEIRFFDGICLSQVKKLITRLNKDESIISSIGFVIPFNSNFNKDTLQEFLKENPRISFLIIYGSTLDEFIEPVRKNGGYIIFSKKLLLNEKCCGAIHANYFVSNIKNFTESQHHNTCLNRKISIDANGNIKNCPSMPLSFGNIKDTTLQEALDHPEFKKYWNITKDQISVCKDCEFRHVCTDCRAYIENPEDQYSKPLKCGYNPYTNEWAEWSTNPLKQKAIDYYGMQDLVKKDA